MVARHFARLKLTYKYLILTLRTLRWTAQQALRTLRYSLKLQASTIAQPSFRQMQYCIYFKTIGRNSQHKIVTTKIEIIFIASPTLVMCFNLM
jgi:hypothetical protein